MPAIPVSPLRSNATVMNYANPLVFVQSTMTQGCKQLTSGTETANLSASLTAALPTKLLSNTTGVTEVTSEGTEMRCGRPQELFQQQMSPLMWSEAG